MTEKPAMIWSELNERQREYLQAGYRIDQADEAAKDGLDLGEDDQE